MDAKLRVTVTGSGDAFGDGGRLQTCLHLQPLGGPARDGLLIDCGASALSGLKRGGLEPNDVTVVVVSHLHGDHFGGLPFDSGRPVPAPHQAAPSRGSGRYDELRCAHILLTHPGPQVLARQADAFADLGFPLADDGTILEL
ncbi:MBL fold metallo-hydrolase [Actinoallomurus acanthiterrae]